MDKTSMVTKSEYQNKMVGYYIRIPRAKTAGLGFCNANHEYLRAIAICLREVNNDQRLAAKMYIHLLEGGDISINVVSYLESESNIGEGETPKITEGDKSPREPNIPPKPGVSELLHGKLYKLQTYSRSYKQARAIANIWRQEDGRTVVIKKFKQPKIVCPYQLWVSPPLE